MENDRLGVERNPEVAPSELCRLAGGKQRGYPCLHSNKRVAERMLAKPAFTMKVAGSTRFFGFRAAPGAVRLIRSKRRKICVT